MKEAGSAIYDNRFEHLPKRNVSLRYYLQSYKYFQLVEEQLRVDLTFKPNILAAARQWLNENTPREWRAKSFVRVLIHVRRTDLTSWGRIRDGWTKPPIDYFWRSMSYFSDCLERVQFVVLSDDVRWCKMHIHATNIVYSVGHMPLVDMAIASLCDHAIITTGTYGWWAAWLANGITITQSNFPRKGSPLTRRFHRDDFYKPEWITL